MLEAFEEWKNTKSRHKDFPDEDAYLYGAEDAWRECLKFVKSQGITDKDEENDGESLFFHIDKSIIDKELGE